MIMIISWKWKVVYNSKLVALYCAFLPNIKLFGPKIRIQFNNTPLVGEQNNFTTKTVSFLIVYSLDK